MYGIEYFVDKLSMSMLADLIAIKMEKDATGKINEKSKGICETYKKALSSIGFPNEEIEKIFKNVGISKDDLERQECECSCLSKLSNEDVYKKLSIEQKKYVSEEFQMEHVREDVKEYIAESDDCVLPDKERKDAIAVMDTIADNVAEWFVKKCKYSRDSTYWTNIERLIVKEWKEIKGCNAY